MGKTNNIIVIFGLQGAGKDTLANIYNKLGYKKAKLYTTRRKRDENDNNYRFVTKEQYDKNKYLINKMYTNYEGGKLKNLYYGLSEDEIRDNDRYVVVAEIEDLYILIDKYGDRVLPVLVYADKETRLERAKQRGNFDIKSFEKREKEDYNNYTYKVREFIDVNYVTIENDKTTKIEKLEEEIIFNCRLKDFFDMVVNEN